MSHAAQPKVEGSQSIVSHKLHQLRALLNQNGGQEGEVTTDGPPRRYAFILTCIAGKRLHVENFRDMGWGGRNA